MESVSQLVTKIRDMTSSRKSLRRDRRRFRLTDNWNSKYICHVPW